MRNELACLSAALSYAVESDLLERNPCLKVERPSRHKRERLITHDEYLAVFVATRSVQRAMVLAVRTLAQPIDVLAMRPRNIIRNPDGSRILRFQRGKTGVPVAGSCTAWIGAPTRSTALAQCFVANATRRTPT